MLEQELGSVLKGRGWGIAFAALVVKTRVPLIMSRVSSPPTRLAGSPFLQSEAGKAFGLEPVGDSPQFRHAAASATHRLFVSTSFGNGQPPFQNGETGGPVLLCALAPVPVVWGCSFRLGHKVTNFVVNLM